MITVARTTAKEVNETREATEYEGREFRFVRAFNVAKMEMAGWSKAKHPELKKEIYCGATNDNGVLDGSFLMVSPKPVVEEPVNKKPAKETKAPKNGKKPVGDAVKVIED